ncbi:DNA adenine methylase [Pectobacterium parmentieri]|uniref:DNA adenine methylase n=1 Tax=Enterobacterales TaxID=91347 RepID=UPI001CBD54AB|nr:MULTISPECIES: DNA adenine methylase [Enterobacterales]MCL6354305.1 DNA adenine methylase [Pectobacterium parmentieri]MCS3607435.1 DNA adenine methylase [Erwinia rhapontici]
MSKPSHFKTPLRYPGGKAKFSHHIEQVIQHNDLVGGSYAEPYAGGAGVALGLLINGLVTDIYINDIDPAIYAFWFAVINHNEKLCEMIEEASVTIENWHFQRQILLNNEEHNIIDTAFATFFLNRTNRSGILKAGVIGGKTQSGKWKLDARFNKQDLIKRIKLIGTLKDKVHVSNLDAIDFIFEKVKPLPNKKLIYLDPPYYVKGAELYRNFYQHEDHVKIAKVLEAIKSPWIVSYDNVDEIKEIYKSFRMADYSLSYTAQDKKKGSEVIIYNNGLIAPKIGV